MREPKNDSDRRRARDIPLIFEVAATLAVVSAVGFLAFMVAVEFNARSVETMPVLLLAGVAVACGGLAGLWALVLGLDRLAGKAKSAALLEAAGRRLCWLAGGVLWFASGLALVTEVRPAASTVAHLIGTVPGACLGAVGLVGSLVAMVYVWRGNPEAWHRRRVAWARGDLLSPILEQRSAAFKLVLEGDRKDAVEAFIHVLGCSNSAAAQEAARWLGDIGDQSAVEPLMVALHDSSDVVTKAKPTDEPEAMDDRERQFVAEGLAALYPHDPLRLAVARSLSRSPVVQARYIGPEETAKLSLCATVAEALGKLGDPRAIEPLKELLDAEDNSVRRAAKKALANLRRRGVTRAQ